MIESLSVPGPDELLAIMVAASFAAGLNVYATVATLGLLARAGWFVLPPELAFLESYWVIGGGAVMFAIEFVADKVPVLDLIWNLGQTFVRIPVAALLAWSAATPLSPGAQIVAAVAGGVIALAAHGGKLAVRGAVTASPEPFSNILLSLAEDVFAIGLTWFATSHPYLAAGIAIVLFAAAAAAIWAMWTLVGRSFRRLRGWWISGRSPVT
ncbi:MAG TPA: DUF4126 domain-containing protein [Vicinamibacterales bacterium]|nr:DUF4126 domain-containing protein [Vicinamibacterales bacterium]